MDEWNICPLQLFYNLGNARMKMIKKLINNYVTTYTYVCWY